MRESSLDLAYDHLRNIEQLWPFLLVLASPGKPGLAVELPLSPQEREELSERIKRRGVQQLADRDEMIRRGLKPMGASPSPTDLRIFDVVILAGAQVLELEADVRQRVGLQPWTAPSSCPRCAGPVVWDQATSELRCAAQPKPPWRRCGNVISYDADNLAWFQGDRPTSTGRGRRWRTLEPYHRPITHDGPDMRAALAAKWIRSQLHHVDHDPDYVRYVERTAHQALRSIDDVVRDVPLMRSHPETPCPYCGYLSIVSNPRDDDPLITCTSNGGPGRLILCRCPEGCSKCSNGDRHTWRTSEWESLGWTKLADPAVLAAVGLKPPTTKRSRKGRRSA